MLLTSARLTAFRQTAIRYLLDTVFPLVCLGCGTTGHWICPACFSRLPVRLKQRCPVCLHHTTPHGEICFSCYDERPSVLDGVFAASSYHDPLLSLAIHTYKYRFLSGLAEPLGQFLAQTLERSGLLLPDVLIPVPLHPRRLRFRGFNQSLLLAEELSKLLTPGLDLPVITDTLVRTRTTKPQMRTHSREERLENLKNAFAFSDTKKEMSVRDKHIWLIDDVSTTGTTLTECATILKQHGAKSVFGIVLAR